MNYQETEQIFVYVEKRKVSFGEHGLFVVGYEWPIDERLEENLVSLCEEEKCLFLQIETLDYSLVADTSFHDTELQQGYYKKFIPPYTAVIDLEKTLDDILAAMKPKGRYNIRLAEKKWVTIERVETNPKNIHIFHDLIIETTNRNNFSANNCQYYEMFFKRLSEGELFFAYYQEKVIAAGIFIPSGNTFLYYYGASSNEYRNIMAPYLLQWEAIKYAQEQGFQLYDFLGIAGPDEKNSPLAGVTDFKKKLSPDTRYVSESFIYIHKKMKYKLIQNLRTWFKK